MKTVPRPDQPRKRTKGETEFDRENKEQWDQINSPSDAVKDEQKAEKKTFEQEKQ